MPPDLAFEIGYNLRIDQLIPELVPDAILGDFVNGLTGLWRDHGVR
jgi:hypothetical protein